MPNVVRNPTNDFIIVIYLCCGSVLLVRGFSGECFTVFKTTTTKFHLSECCFLKIFIANTILMSEKYFYKRIY